MLVKHENELGYSFFACILSRLICLGYNLTKLSATFSGRKTMCKSFQTLMFWLQLSNVAFWSSVLHQTGSAFETGAGLSSSGIGVPQTASLPPLEDLDVAVLESLPPEVVSEINDMYGGKLLGYISKIKSKIVNRKVNAASSRSGEGKLFELCL